jgi:hypothetical protein
MRRHQFIGRWRAVLPAALVFAFVVTPADTVASRHHKPRYHSYYLGQDIVEINGESYTRSIFVGQGMPAGAMFDVHRRCKQLAYVAGLVDGDKPTDVVEASVQADGRDLDRTQFGYGHSKSRVLHVRGALRLGFNRTVINGGFGVVFAWGEARVKCTKPPTRL